MPENPQLLRNIPSCVVCHNEDPRAFFSKDHILPRKAGEVYGAIKPLVGSPDNFANVCPQSHHQRIDSIKMPWYFRMGLVGAVDYIGGYYPRYNNMDFRDIQFKQFKRLFSQLKNTIVDLNGNTPIVLKDRYQQAADKADYYLVRWERGDFEVVGQVLASA